MTAQQSAEKTKEITRAQKNAEETNDLTGLTFDAHGDNRSVCNKPCINRSMLRNIYNPRVLVVKTVKVNSNMK